MQVNDVVNSRYSTVYFDTDDFKLYTQHHNGKLNRYKVRTRRYEDSNINFFEIKFKTNTKRTIKKRIQTNTFSEKINPKRQNFIDNNSNLEQEELNPKINVLYNRATLVSKELNERLTIDTCLNFESKNNTANFAEIAIIEIKRNRGLKSYADIVLRDNGIYPRSISKYCLGISSLYENVKKNNFKLKFNSIKKLCYENV
ncbi:MAG: polyphosphate polymerase domain-containing protein [Bacteroidales bacterium]|nr:polyphosphate polymerase domain-containing protein [Bacteroidales bacterium]